MSAADGEVQVVYCRNTTTMRVSGPLNDRGTGVDFGRIRVGELAAQIAAHLGVQPAESLVLVRAGTILRNMDLALPRAGVTPGCKIYVVKQLLQQQPSSTATRQQAHVGKSSSSRPHVSASKASASASASASQAAVDPETKDLDAVSTLRAEIVLSVAPELDKFNDLCKGKSAGNKVDKEAYDKLKLYITERLLQGLLKLDEVQLRSEHQRARTARKEAIKYIQGLMDSVDQAAKKHAQTS